MANAKQTSLPDAEFFMLNDERFQNRTFAPRRRQYDDDPSASEALRQRQRAAWRAVDPTWRLSKRSPARRRGKAGNFPLPPELVPRSAAFKTNAPKSIPHYTMLVGYGFDPIGSVANNFIHVVSTAWKSAVESLEPGIHESTPSNSATRMG